MKTEHLAGRSTHAYFLVARHVAQLSQLFHTSRFIQCTCIGSRHDESSQHVCPVLKTVRLLHSHSFRLVSSRNLLALPDRHFTFPGGVETASEIHCNDPGGGGWFGRMAEQSPLTGYEPNSLIEISSAHTPIIFPSRRNSFHTDFNDVPAIAASDDTDTLDAGVTSPLFTQEREVNPFSDSVASASSSKRQQQHTAASIIQCHS